MNTQEGTEKKSKITIQSVDRALNIVEFIAKNNGNCGLSEISRSLGLNKATAYGLLSTLELFGCANNCKTIYGTVGC